MIRKPGAIDIIQSANQRVCRDQKARLILDVGRPKVNLSSQRRQANQECKIRLAIFDLIDGSHIRVYRCELDRNVEPLGQFPTEINDHATELSRFLIAEGNVR